jgi:adenylate cyclase
MLEWILSIGSRPEDSADIRLKKRIFAPMNFAGVLVGVMTSAVQAGFGVLPAAWVPLVLSGIFILNLAILGITGNLPIPRIIGFLTLLSFPPLDQWMMGGFFPGGAISLWGISAPFGAFLFQNARAAVPQFIAYVIVATLAIVAEIVYPSPWPRPTIGFSYGLLIFDFAGFVLFVMMNVMHFVQGKEQAMDALSQEHKLLQAEREKSEKLLLNVLPEVIATRLKKDESFIADRYPQVSILFADIVNFTPLSNRLSPEDLVNMLNQIFSRFDLLAETFGLEKIKTIGDAYMAAAGLPTERPDHARACIEMALAMQQEIAKLDLPETKELQLRIGIHTGPVVAGVIGLRKFIYDLWGDAVNTASRMESHGIPGSIHITDEVRQMVDGEFDFKDRGIIEVKGKGPMRTWMVTRLS